MAGLAEEYLDRIRRVQPAGPYHLVGWSFGGNVAHAMATRLREQGEEVALLALLDSYPPEWQELADSLDEPDLLAALLTSLGIAPADFGDGTLGRAQFVERLRAADSTVSSLGPEALALLPDIYTRHVRLLREPVSARFDGDLLFFTAAHSRPANGAGHEAWRPHITGDLKNFMVAGHHDGLTQPAPLAEIGPALAAALNKPTTRRPADSDPRIPRPLHAQGQAGGLGIRRPRRRHMQADRYPAWARRLPGGAKFHRPLVNGVPWRLTCLNSPPPPAVLTSE